MRNFNTLLNKTFDTDTLGIGQIGNAKFGAWLRELTDEELDAGAVADGHYRLEDGTGIAFVVMTNNDELTVQMVMDLMTSVVGSEHKEGKGKIVAFQFHGALAERMEKEEAAKDAREVEKIKKRVPVLMELAQPLLSVFSLWQRKNPTVVELVEPKFNKDALVEDITKEVLARLAQHQGGDMTSDPRRFSDLPAYMRHSTRYASTRPVERARAAAAEAPVQTAAPSPEVTRHGQQAAFEALRPGNVSQAPDLKVVPSADGSGKIMSSGEFNTNPPGYGSMIGAAVRTMALAEAMQQQEQQQHHHQPPEIGTVYIYTNLPPRERDLEVQQIIDMASEDEATKQAWRYLSPMNRDGVLIAIDAKLSTIDAMSRLNALSGAQPDSMKQQIHNQIIEVVRFVQMRIMDLYRPN